MIILMFLVAILLSAVAAYYSIAGLVAIFAAAVMPIIIMGGMLEVAKLVVASWLYRNWKQVPVMLKTYFSIALIILMTLTSMGIFGYLSKAHLDQAVPMGDVAAKLQIIDEKISTEKELINDYRSTLAQLDSQVNETIARTANDTTDKGIRRSIAARKAQARERSELRLSLEASQKKIGSYQEARAPIASQLRAVEAEVGPIKYIAALIYGDNADQNLLESAVRIVILMIVSVFDPLAVLMLIAANWSLNQRKEDKDETPTEWHQEWVPNSEAWPEWDNKVSEDFNPKEETQDAVVVDEHAYLQQPWTWIKPEEKSEPDVEWPEDESRIDIIGSNGNEGIHYQETTQPSQTKVSKKTLGRYHEQLAKSNAKLKKTSIEEEIKKLQI